MTERVLVLIPALNAAKHIGPVVRESLQQLHDVVVIDDGSNDDTGAVAREAGVQIVLRHDVNRAIAIRSQHPHARSVQPREQFGIRMTVGILFSRRNNRPLRPHRCEEFRRG